VVLLNQSSTSVVIWPAYRHIALAEGVLRRWFGIIQDHCGKLGSHAEPHEHGGSKLLTFLEPNFCFGDLYGIGWLLFDGDEENCALENLG